MKGLMFQKSQKITELEKENEKLQLQVQNILRQYNNVQKELQEINNSINKNNNQIQIFHIDRQMLQRQIKIQIIEEEKLKNQIQILQKLYKQIQQSSLKSQSTYYELSNKDQKISQRLLRLKQQYKIYLTIGQSQSNIVNLTHKLENQKKTHEKMLQILQNKQKARQKYLNLIVSKRQKNEQINQKQKTKNISFNEKKDKLNLFKIPLSISPKNTLKNYQFVDISNNKQIKQSSIANKEKTRKFDELTRKKNMILNKK